MIGRRTLLALALLTAVAVVAAVVTWRSSRPAESLEWDGRQISVAELRQEFRLARLSQPVSVGIICARLAGKSAAAAGQELGVMFEADPPDRESSLERLATIFQEECR